MLTCSASRLSRVVAKALRHLFNISIGMPFVHKMYGRIGLCAMCILYSPQHNDVHNLLSQSVATQATPTVGKPLPGSLEQHDSGP